MRRTTMEMSRVQNRPILSSITNLIKGGRGVMILAPVTKAGQPDGFVAGVFQCRELVKAVVPDTIAPGYNLTLSEKGGILGTRGEKLALDHEAPQVVRKIKLPGVTWELKAWPASNQAGSSSICLSTLVLAFGLLGTLLLPLTVFLGQRARSRANDLLGEIVARENVEAALRSSNALQQAILDGANFSIISTDPQGTILTFNHGAERMLGYRANEVIGMVTPEIIHLPEEVAAVAEMLSQKFGRPVKPGFEVFVMESRAGEASEREWTYVRKDGRRLPVLLSVTALFDDHGEISRYLGIAVDMTEKRQVEEKRDALLRNLENLNLALNQLGIVSFADENGLITRVNERFCAISGYTQEELLGCDLSVLYSGHHSPEFYQEMWETLRSGKIWKGEICNRAKDGSLYWVDAVMVPFLDAKGKPYQYVAIRIDITEQKRVGIEMAKARDLALESARLKAEFLANMSHEIRTPMNGVIGMTDLLLDSGLSGRELSRAQAIRNSAEALMALLNDILDFSKIEAGKLSFDTVDFNLREVVEDCMDLMAGAAQKKEILLGSILETGVPEEVRGDPTRVRQVISNLVGNAIKFTAEGEVVLRVDVIETTEAVTTLRLEVRDTGIGIAPDAMQRLFKPFVQADGSTTRKFGGTGLGLAISRQLVQMMEGDIEVQSELGKGSTFILHDPVGTPAGRSPHGTGAQGESARGARASGG
ncbi:MAG: PAS domain S-box protein [Chthoniobacteraceae bacterium]